MRAAARENTVFRLSAAKVIASSNTGESVASKHTLTALKPGAVQHSESREPQARPADNGSRRTSTGTNAARTRSADVADVHRAGGCDSRPRLALHSPGWRWRALFQVVLFAVDAVRRLFGESGLLVSGAVLGLTDVDALTISMARTAGAGIAPHVAAQAIAIGILPNSGLKLGLALVYGTPPFRRLTVRCAGGDGGGDCRRYERHSLSDRKLIEHSVRSRQDAVTHVNDCDR